MPLFLRHMVFGLCTCLTAYSSALQADESLTVEPGKEPSAVFGESEVTFTYVVKSADRFDGLLSWVHSARQRTIARGEVAVLAGGGNEPAEIKISLRIPPVREGIAFDTELTVSLLARGDRQPKAEHSRTVWIFPSNPFVDRTEWLEELGITLFDPVGETRAALDAMKIPFKEVRSPAALEQVESGLIIIGEGLSFYDVRALGDILPTVASKGKVVLALAPRDGRLVLPGTRDAEGRAPRKISVRRGDVIAELDKRLDTESWSREGGLVTSRLEIASYRGLVTAEVSAEETAWPWLEIDYAQDGKGKLVICGLGLVEHWEASPNARFFLAAWFEEVGKQIAPLSETGEESR